MHSKDWQSTKHTDPSAAVSVRLVRPFSCHPQFFFHPPLQVNADVFITCVHHVCSVFIHIMCVTNCINLFLLGLFICFFTCLMILMALCGFAKFEAFAAPPSCCNTCQECELELFGRNDCSSACFQCQSCSIQYVFNMCSIHACNLRIRSSCGGCSPKWGHAVAPWHWPYHWPSWRPWGISHLLPDGITTGLPLDHLCKSFNHEVPQGQPRSKVQNVAFKSIQTDRKEELS